MTPEVSRNESTPGRFDRFFEITARGSSVAREVRGGIVTFFTMAYIIVLNPLIIGYVADVNGNTLGPTAVASGTALVAGVMTILMGLIGNFPLAIAAGLGLNAFVAFTLAPIMSWPAAMGLVVIEGLVIVICVLTRFRTAIFRAVPAELKSAIAVGIGLFIALVGLVDGGIVHAPESLAPPLELGTAGHLAGWPTVVFVFGLLLTAVLLARKVKGALLIGIVAAAILAFVLEAVIPTTGWQHGAPVLPQMVASAPDLHLIGEFSLIDAFKTVGILSAVVLAFSLVLSDFFDAMGTIVGVGASGKLLDKHNNPPRIGRVLFIDGLAAVAGGTASVSSNTGFIESAAGVGEGARTGLANVVTGILLVLAMFLAPLVKVIPAEAATPALVIVGSLMAAQVRRIDFSDVGIAIPAFLTMILMPFTYSITNGIGAGFVSYVIIRVFQGRAREVHPLMWLVAMLFVAYFAIEPIERLIGLAG